MKEKHNTNDMNDWSFTYINYMLFVFGMILISMGYILMYTGEVSSYQSIKLAPLLLVIGYCIIIPISILYKNVIIIGRL